MAGERDLEWICRLLGLNNVSQIVSREQLDINRLEDTLKAMREDKWDKNYLVFTAQGNLHMYGHNGRVDVPIEGLALIPGVKTQKTLDFVKGMALLRGSFDQRLTLSMAYPDCRYINKENTKHIKVESSAVNWSAIQITLEPLMIKPGEYVYPLIEAYTVKKPAK